MLAALKLRNPLNPFPVLSRGEGARQIPRGGGASHTPSFTSSISQVLTSAQVGGACGPKRRGLFVLTQRKKPIYGQFLLSDVFWSGSVPGIPAHVARHRGLGRCQFPAKEGRGLMPRGWECPRAPDKPKPEVVMTSNPDKASSHVTGPETLKVKKSITLVLPVNVIV